MEFKEVIKGNVKKKYKNFLLEVEDFSIPKGFTTALIGENGAGKSTLINILSGIRQDYKGELHYFDEGLDIEDKGVKEKIGYTGTRYYFLPSWTGTQIKELSEILFDGFDPKKYDEIVAALNIDKDIFGKKAKSVSKLSDGNLTKLMLAAVFSRKTELLLLDEPASPLDPLMRSTLSDMIRAYISEGDGERTVFFSTHNVADMESVTDYAMIMEKGKIVEKGFVEELKEKYQLVKGEAVDYEAVKKYLYSGDCSQYGFEGIILSSDISKVNCENLYFEQPTLSQIVVAVMKKYSDLKTPIV